MRGSTFTQVLILIDGIRWSEPLTAHLNASLPIPLSEIERIEVIHGPASAVYGADAVGGVIHIQTKTFANTKQAGFQSNGRGYYGQHDLIDADLSASYGGNDWTVSAGYKKTSSDGEEFRNPNFQQDISDREVYNTFFDIETFTVGTRFRPDDEWTIRGRFAKDERDYDAKYFYTQSPYDESYEANTFYLGQLSAEYQVDNRSTLVAFGFREGSDYFAFNPAFAANDHTTRTKTGLLTHQFETKQSNVFSLGVQLDQVDVESTDRGNHDQNQMEAFATSLLQLNDNLSAVLSARGGHNDDYGLKFTPQASVSYNQDSYLLRASVGRAIRGPNFTEKYVSFNLPELAPGRNIGNPYLDVEQSTTIDAGGEFLLNKDFKTSLTGFYRWSDQLIDYIVTDADKIDYVTNLTAGETYFQAQNIGSATTFGIEFQQQYEKQWSDHRSFAGLLGYTFLTTELSDGVVSKYLAGHPNHQINLNTTLTAKKLHVTVNNQYLNRNGDALAAIDAEIPASYFLTHATMGYSVSNNVAVTARANNLFDVDYQEIFGANMPSRWISAGLKWDFN